MTEGWSYSKGAFRPAFQLGSQYEDKNGDVYVMCQALEPLSPGQPCGHANFNAPYRVIPCDAESTALVGMPVKQVPPLHYFWALVAMSEHPSEEVTNAFSIAHLNRCLKL